VVCGIAAFLTGVFLDIDHLIDCYINHGPHFDLKNFYSYCREIRFERLTLIFHSYELIALFWLSIFIFSLGDIYKAMAIGMTQHLIFDQLANMSLGRMKNGGYFLTFRLKNRFRKEGIIKKL